ncbi:methenyltetrahydromethanopterin cyclohydrolase [Azospirillum sp. HJ39]
MESTGDVIPSFSVNRLAATLVHALVADAAMLRIGVEQHPAGCTVIDAGIGRPGSLEAGRRIAEICLGGAADPVLACLGSQYAGWRLTGERFSALGSGPGRALAVKEPLFAELGYRDMADRAVLVLETDKRPPASVVEKVARDCGVPAERVTLILTPTRSPAGIVQIVARVLEVGLYKLHALHFPLERVRDGIGCAPLPPPGRDFVQAMGRTNDAILFGGTVHLLVDRPDDDAADLAARLPSSASADYGRPFADLFAASGCDFFKIDPMLFSPARAIVTAFGSGRSFSAGALAPALLDRSFGIGG